MDVRPPAPQDRIIAELVAGLQRIYGAGLRSVILYGSAASGEYARGRSNINVLIVLSDTSLQSVGRAAQLLSGITMRSVAPLFATEDYIRTSADVFPIEFLDIKENYRVLFGADPLKDLPIDTRNLRFQCEQEIRSKLITIRSRYIGARGRQALERLLYGSFNSTVHLLRNVLRLKGIAPPYRKDEILGMVEESLGIDATVLNEIYYAKTKSMKLTYRDADSLLCGLARQLDSVAVIVDAM